jgi:RNA polymerase sigma-70 factor, ECF subfamily
MIRGSWCRNRYLARRPLSGDNTPVAPDPSPRDDEPTDAELMERLGRSEMSALAVLVGRYQERVRMLAFRILGKWDLADDMTQDVFLRLYRTAGRYRPDMPLMALLRRIVVNLCLDWRKRAKPGPWPTAEPMAGDHWTVSGTVEKAEKVSAIRDEIAQLPERQRIALTLHRFEELTHEEIAAVTGWSPSAVESLLVRAYSRLRERLRPWL